MEEKKQKVKKKFAFALCSLLLVLLCGEDGGEKLEGKWLLSVG